MSNFFISLYNFFNRNRILFYLVLLSFLILILVFASRIRFEEDILKSLPGKGTKDQTNYVVGNLKLTDKLIITISLKDTLAAASPDSLQAFGARLVDSLSYRYDSAFIRSISFRASDSLMEIMTSLVTGHLPSFLDEKDYLKIDSIIGSDAIKKALQKDYRILLSPGSIVLKKRIMQDPLALTNLAFKKLSSLQAGSNFVVYNGSIFTQDLQHLLIFISPANTVNETSKNTQLIEGLTQTIKQLSNDGKGHVNAEFFGSVAVSVSNATQLKKDIAVTLAIAFSLIFLLLGWYFRSLRVPLLGLLPAIFGGGMALAILYLTRGKISAISLGIGSVILGLIVDYALYMINHFRRKGNIEAVLREMSQTIVVCSLTTAGAFLCLIFLESTVLNDLGWFAALSVLGAAFFALAFLPQFLTQKSARAFTRHQPSWVDKFATIRFDKNPYLTGILLVLIIASLFFAKRAGFEKNMSSLSYVTPALSNAESHLSRISDFKLKNIYLVSTGRNSEEALKNHEKLNPLLSSATRNALVSQVSGAGHLLQSDSLQRIKISQWNGYWTSDRKMILRNTLEKEAALLGFKSGAFDGFFNMINELYQPLSAGDPELLSNPLVADWLTVKPGITLISSILKVKEENKPAVYEMFNKASGNVMFDKQLLTDKFIASVKHDFDLLVMLSMLFVSILLVISFGRIELGIIAALPMFISWLITLGFMGLTGTRFNIFNIIISSFIFGLGVDYSILMVRGLQHDYKFEKNDISAYKVSIFLSSVTTIFGVGALFFARHPALHSIAMIALVGIVSVVMITFVIPPFLFNALITDRTARKKFPVTARIVIKTFVTWGNIVAIALLLMILGWIMYLFVPVRKKRKEYWFHWMFSKLSKAYIAFTFAWARKYDNPRGEDFSTPGIIISNHQSLIETPAFLRLYPKIIILTTTWVHKSPVFGPIAHLANFSNVENGIDSIMGDLREKVSEGFSILIFPEGHRSADHKIQRFHRGAFYLAEKLKVDVIPLVVFGSGDFLPKDTFWGRPNYLTMRVLPRVACNDPGFGGDYVTRSKQFRKYYVKEYEKIKAEEGNGTYYRRRLILNYIFKGPVIEWYLKAKLSLENNYSDYCRLLPVKGDILDLGCGYGFISYMLAFTAAERRITGVDYDAEKIRVAENAYDKEDRITFTCADVSEFDILPQDGYLLSDILHYLPPPKQEYLLRRCLENLNPGGVILIREANAELTKRHKKSKLTEFLSTRIGFNKTTGNDKTLFFTTVANIHEIVAEYGMELQVLDLKKFTSNNLLVITRRPALN